MLPVHEVHGPREGLHRLESVHLPMVDLLLLHIALSTHLQARKPATRVSSLTIREHFAKDSRRVKSCAGPGTLDGTKACICRD